MGFIIAVIVKYHSLQRDHSYMHSLSHITILIMALESKEHPGIIMRIIQETRQNKLPYIM